jgi:hypothetical protein
LFLECLNEEKIPKIVPAVSSKGISILSQWNFFVLLLFLGDGRAWKMALGALVLAALLGLISVGPVLGAAAVRSLILC